MSAYKGKDTEEIVVPDDNMQFIIIEDNLMVSDYLTSVLRKHFSPCTTTSLSSISSSIACLKENKDKYHLILLDTTLKLKGEESCAAIREVDPETPIILMAVIETKVTDEYIISCGADGILYKPLEVKEIIDEIKRIIKVDMSQRGSRSGFYPILKLDKEKDMFP